jgi:hypothetical protein
MDILQETRQTQVQLPVEVLEGFFDGAPGRRASVTLRHTAPDGTIVKTDRRPFIHLPNDTHRLEIDAIRGLPRPQIIRFRRPSRSSAPIEYDIVLRGDVLPENSATRRVRIWLRMPRGEGPRCVGDGLPKSRSSGS